MLKTIAVELSIDEKSKIEEMLMMIIEKEYSLGLLCSDFNLSLYTSKKPKPDPAEKTSWICVIKDG